MKLNITFQNGVNLALNTVTPGAKGESLSNISLNHDTGELTFTLTNGTSINVGSIETIVAAVEAKDAATTQAGIAVTKAGEAATSASTATTQAGIATTKAGEASTSAEAATTQAGIATTKAGEANTSANTATVQAAIATAQANSASASASTATTQAEIAAQKATEASNNAATATIKAGEASDSALIAADKADLAADKATEADNCADISTTKANEASNSAIASALSETNSANSASSAATSALNAETAETNAKTAETNANNSAIAADNSADAAAASAATIEAILASGAAYDFTPTKLISLVQSGLAPYILPVGSQLIMPWTDKSNANTVYQIPWDVLAHETCLDPDGNTKPCMTLGWHYTTPYGVQFSNYQAFYSATAELPAGTYYITVGTNWGTYGKTGETYSFTLTQPVPIGGQLSGFEGLPDANPTGWKVKSWASNAALVPIETVSVTAGANGTSLGQLKPGGDGTLNCIQSVAYGYNRWSTSAMRQWLNSDKAAGAWWTPQHKFDRIPAELATKPGFLTGLDVEFKQILPKSKITTALNTVTDVALGTTEVTVDKVFLASLEQMYITPQLATVEGPTWEYWKVASGRTTPLPTAVATPEYVCYGIDNTATAQYVRLRCAGRGGSYGAWAVSPSGYVCGSNASASWRCLPVVRIY